MFDSDNNLSIKLLTSFISYNQNKFRIRLEGNSLNFTKFS